MAIQKSEVLQIRNQADVVVVRQNVRTWAANIGMSIVDQTKIVTASSELARNTHEYGGGGTATLQSLEENGRKGLRIIFEDNGPGIPDIDQALKDGFTTGGGMGMGLGGSKRLSSEFSITSEVGKGTCVTITRWK